jgi:hypothetical protein
MKMTFAEKVLMLHSGEKSLEPGDKEGKGNQGSGSKFVKFLMYGGFLLLGS